MENIKNLRNIENLEKSKNIEKLKNIIVIFGGISTEHDISILSGLNIIKNLEDRHENIYNVLKIYIDKQNNWYEISDFDFLISYDISNIEDIKSKFNVIKKQIKDKKSILTNCDKTIIALHGIGGEDGTIQKYLESLGVCYVGCKELCSKICMNKLLTKKYLDKYNIPNSKYTYITRNDDKYFIEDKNINYLDIQNEVLKKLDFPIYIKPQNGGSSIGVTKVSNADSFYSSLNLAFDFDDIVLIEQMQNAKEVEVGIIEKNGELIAGIPGEIVLDSFYSFDDKYKSDLSRIPADISDDMQEEVIEFAKNVFRIIGAKDLARIDLFVSDNIVLNEINTFPGFTNSSMFAKMFAKKGINMEELLDILIENN